ncbi:MAG: hypothetical protein UT24_C0019G0029 [Candidatus Woesebacteria bacterium GW2011_GWB1_39_12]|uniref:Uncharacterized protein n=1 Tax=Candidatus Woesebacteria bacterium GW2011_GWB1_39_12 TaxID=1618574 RepID=A0A0G0PP95_9BACT|nr:MAG: hypothetical protein UT24_C0019G0029 [Candidatus Woesebacteria bacterium GW2011_GWB1_39_12]
MKRYHMFGGDNYESNGGWNEHLRSSDSLQELTDSVKYDIYDADAEIAKIKNTKGVSEKDKEKWITDRERMRGMATNFSVGGTIYDWIEIIDLETEEPVWQSWRLGEG